MFKKMFKTCAALRPAGPACGEPEPRSERLRQALLQWHRSGLRHPMEPGGVLCGGPLQAQAIRGGSSLVPAAARRRAHRGEPSMLTTN